MSRWYRAYEGTVSDPKLIEASLVAGCKRSVTIAAWHALLEACASNQGPEHGVTIRRLQVILDESAQVCQAVMDAFAELGLVEAGTVTAWKRRQFASDSSTERSRKHREQKCNVAKTLQEQYETPEERGGNAPYTETDTEQNRTEGREDAQEREELTPTRETPSLPQPTQDRPNYRNPHGQPGEYSKRLADLIDTWNAAGLPACRNPIIATWPRIGEINNTLAAWPQDACRKALEAYAVAFNTPGEYQPGICHWTTLWGFLAGKGMDHWNPDARPLERMAKAGKAKTAAELEIEAYLGVTP